MLDRPVIANLAAQFVVLAQDRRLRNRGRRRGGRGSWVRMFRPSDLRGRLRPGSAGERGGGRPRADAAVRSDDLRRGRERADDAAKSGQTSKLFGKLFQNSHVFVQGFPKKSLAVLCDF